MKFYVLEGAYERSFEKEESLYAHTSVREYKKWLFECLRQYGEIVTIKSTLKIDHARRIFAKPDSIFLSVPGSINRAAYRNIPRRILTLSVGTLLLYPQSLYGVKSTAGTQALLISTDFQIERLNSVFNGLLPKMFYFPPKIDTDFFTIPSEEERALARKKEKIRSGDIHIVFAGRWVSTKGICQLIRMLDMWPVSNAVVTVAGNAETGRRHFSDFLHMEVLERRKRRWLRLRPAMKKHELRELFWSADIFINPSIQPDENFGITPREAASCGLGVVTTNFAGLRPLAESMPWKGLDTYPTMSGSRFSLRGLRNLLQIAIRDYSFSYAYGYRRAALEESDIDKVRKNLSSAVKYLKNRPPQKPTYNIRIMEETKRRLFDTAGSYAYGDGAGLIDYSLPILQGIYSAQNSPPIVKSSSSWRGFFRLSLWQKEKAIVEFGFPGTGIRRYSEKLWRSLSKCSRLDKSNEYVIVPKDKLQVSLVQELVNIGYLVPDD